MKAAWVLPVLLAACAALGAACAREASRGSDPPAAPSEVSSVVQTATLKVPELTCEGCASQIRELLGPMPGVVDVRTNVKRKTVTVQLDTTLLTMDAVIATLAKEKYLATPAAVAN